MRRAATVLIFNDQGKVLGVSRRHDHNDFGLPGGKCDPGETPEQTAIRELYEETGLTLQEPRIVFSQPDPDNYLTTTFTGRVTGEIASTEEGVIAWIDVEKLCSGSFGEYNRKLLDVVNMHELQMI